MISGRKAKTRKKKMMISPIGNRFGNPLTDFLKKKNGISFFEVMVTIAILSLGLVMIFRAFFISLDAINHLTYRWHAMVLLENKLVEIQQRFQTKGEILMELTSSPERAVINRHPVNFGYKTEVRHFADLDDFFQVNLTIFWRERSRDINLSQTAYITRY